MQDSPQVDGNTNAQYEPLNVRYQSFPKLILMVLNICLAPFYFGYNIAYFGTF